MATTEVLVFFCERETEIKFLARAVLVGEAPRSDTGGGRRRLTVKLLQRAGQYDAGQILHVPAWAVVAQPAPLECHA